MKHFFLSTLSAGLALTLMSAPMAMAQPAPNHDSTHMMAPGHSEKSNMPMPHQATPAAHMQMPQHRAMGQKPGHGEAANMAMPHEATPTQRMAYSGHAWHHGDHYNGGRQVVNNWQYYHLHQPPAGYEWVQDGSQFVLIAVASGIVADVIANALNE
jgi:Ni/Co efflux regulator RcnB